MRIALRTAGRLGLTALLGLALSLGTEAQAQTPIEKVLPDSTFLMIKAQNVASLREAFRQSQAGQLWADSALKPLKDDMTEKLEEASKTVQSKIGLTLPELLELPQGQAALAFIGRPEAKIPMAFFLAADAGKNSAKMADVMAKTTKLAEEEGGKVSNEKFKDLTIHVIQPPADKDAKKDDNDVPPPPIAWTNLGTVYYIATDVDALKDVVGHAEGREDSLATNENYQAVLKRVGADSQVVWFLDVARAVNLAVQAGAAKGGGNAQQIQGMLQITGLNALKAFGGSYGLNVGPYDSVSKTYLFAPGQPQGVLKMFQMPKANLRPQPWVPAGVASYQSMSWDLDAAYEAINDLANMFNPGILDQLQQNLTGPNGGEGLNFKKDLFGPLGDRVTIVSDFKKPIKEDSQRVLFAIALEDPKAFQNTLNKLVALAQGQPKRREFQGTTILDFQMPEIPNAAPNNPFKGTVSLAIAKETLFIGFDPTLLEQVLRGGSQSLADNPAFLSVVKDIPPQTSSLAYVRPDEAARQSYEMFKSGQLEKAFEAAGAGGGPDLSKLGKLIDKDKVPDFSVFAKYLSQGGGYSTPDDDGATYTSFTLRKSNP